MYKEKKRWNSEGADNDENDKDDDTEANCYGIFNGDEYFGGTYWSEIEATI
jgi:hypothetical protein